MSDEADDPRESVRRHYSQLAADVGAGDFEAARDAEAGCLPGGGCGSAFGRDLYEQDDSDGGTRAAVQASLGCGVPTAVADLHPGETVLDLGSGAGADLLISAQRVGPAGRAIGVDMTDEMLELARQNQKAAGVRNVELLKGTIEDLPLAADTVDVVISNCVINLSADKSRVFREAARVLRPGGRLAVSDVVADPGIGVLGPRDGNDWTGCIAGALTREGFERELAAAGFDSIEIEESHRIHEHAAAATVRAILPH